MTETLSHSYLLRLKCEMAWCNWDKGEINWYAMRDQIDEIIRTLGSGAYHCGSEGHTTIWNVKEECLKELMRKIQNYNSIKENKHVIMIEMY